MNSTASKLFFAGLVTILLHQQQAYALIGSADVFEHNKTGSRVMLLSDGHFEDIRSAMQQHAIIETATAAPTRLICEDDGGYRKYQVLSGLTKWAKRAGCAAINVEFRGLRDVSVSGKEWAEKILNAIEYLRRCDGGHKESYQEFFARFDSSRDRVILKQLSQDTDNLILALLRVKLNMKPIDKIAPNKFIEYAQMLKMTTNMKQKELIHVLSSYKSVQLDNSDIEYAVQSLIDQVNPMMLGVALNLRMLNEISENNKNNQNSIVAAGALHTMYLKGILKNHAHYTLKNEVCDNVFWQNLRDFKVPMQREYTAHFDPIIIPEITEPSYTPPFRSRVVLPLMQVRGALEDSAFGRWKYRNQAFFNIPGVRPGLKFLAAGISAVGCYLASKFSS